MAYVNKYGIVKVVLLVSLCAVSILPQGFQADDKSTVKAASKVSNVISDEMLGSKAEDGYDQYLIKHKNASRPDQEILIPGEDYSNVVDMEANVVKDIGGMTGSAVETDEVGTISWDFNVSEEGFYNIAVLYYPLQR